ncbi:hypothetical protein AFLA_001361 [Aspergillus flavus NRRL3357]|nr:hypothetical protein AFLA_001361 [Aspergillus flavus NRRL3357]
MLFCPSVLPLDKLGAGSSFPDSTFSTSRISKADRSASVTRRLFGDTSVLNVVPLTKPRRCLDSMACRPDRVCVCITDSRAVAQSKLLPRIPFSGSTSFHSAKLQTPVSDTESVSLAFSPPVTRPEA